MKIKNRIENLKTLFTNKKFLLDLFVSALGFVLVAGVFFKIYLKEYLANLENNPINDELLNILPSIDLDIIATNYIYVLIAVLLGYLLFIKPQKIPFYIKSITMLYFAKYIILPTTNLTYPEGAIHESFDTIYNDLFFSGHTAFPVLLYFLTKDETKYLKYFFLVSAFIEGTTVLLMKLHYTIDVYAAPFFAFSIYSLSFYIFGKNYKKYDQLVS